MSLFVSLDLSAAFDKIDHTILLRRLETSFVVTGNVLKWFASYLSGRLQRVTVNEELSNKSQLSLVSFKGSFLDHFSSQCMPASYLR